MKNRREFLKQSTGVLGLSVLDFKKANKPLLSFSTLGCPTWDFSQVLQYASENQYSGIEIRGIKGNLDLPAHPIFSPTNLASTRRQVADAGLKIVNLGSSANMHFLVPKKVKCQFENRYHRNCQPRRYSIPFAGTCRKSRLHHLCGKRHDTHLLNFRIFEMIKYSITLRFVFIFFSLALLNLKI